LQVTYVFNHCHIVSCPFSHVDHSVAVYIFQISILRGFEATRRTHACFVIIQRYILGYGNV